MIVLYVDAPAMALIFAAKTSFDLLYVESLAKDLNLAGKTSFDLFVCLRTWYGPQFSVKRR